MTTRKYSVTGMSCAACQSHVKNAVCKLDGVTDVNVNLLNNNMTVVMDESVCSDDKVCSAVKNAGYGAYPMDKKIVSDNPHPLKDYALPKLITAIVLLVAIVYVSMGNGMWGFPLPDFIDHEGNPVGNALLQLLLTLPIVFIYRNYFCLFKICHIISDNPLFVAHVFVSFFI